jgi:hypothetical protein
VRLRLPFAASALALVGLPPTRRRRRRDRSAKRFPHRGELVDPAERVVPQLHGRPRRNNMNAP